MRLPNESMHDGTIVDVPFFDREKAIVRGLNQNILERPVIKPREGNAV